MKKLGYYITAHGYGHGTRSFDIINALFSVAPNVSVIVKTDLPPAFIASRLKHAYRLIPGAFDVGLIQKDSIQIDMKASLTAISKFYEQPESLLAQEIDFIRKEGISGVVSDIPAIPLMAAKCMNVPAIAVGNFGWDWIYAEFIKQEPAWRTYAEFFRKAYEQTDVLLRLPFAEPMDAFPNAIDIPLLAEPGSPCRRHIAKLTNADIQKKWILLSFTSLNLDKQALTRFTAMDDFVFFSVDPLEWKGSCIQCIDRSIVPFSDILASMDVVVTKPGFGIVSECIVNDKPIIHATRENFREYPILVEHIKRYCRHATITAEALYAGKLGPAMESIELAQHPNERMHNGGAKIAAHEILARLR